MNILSLESCHNKLVSETGLEWGRVDIKQDRRINVLSKKKKPTKKGQDYQVISILCPEG